MRAASRAPRGAETGRTLEAAAGWAPERVCGQCLWIRDYLRRRVCFAGGQVGRTVRGDEDATFCEEFEEVRKNDF